MTELVAQTNSLHNCESFKSIENVLEMIHLNKNFITTSDNFLTSEVTFYNHLKRLIANSTDYSEDDSQNFLELFLTNQLYAMTIQIHSLADLTAQLIYELGLVELQTRSGHELTIDKITFNNVRNKLSEETTGVYTSLLNALNCFENDSFKYFSSLANTLKHKFIPLTNVGGVAFSGGNAESGFQVDTFVLYEGGNNHLIAAEFLPSILAKYDSFKNEFDQVIVELNNLVS
ncbi:hypothetical protein [Acinetobacter sp. PK01]|uniref:hypothetical protein n=1 Tax=Acinetobacter sp. PK01 TaxID=2930198 RepID=UPI001FB76F5F|nr:hypothetical protein [Acinetobacter sp. PK01]UOG18688.1 hypothetical protein MP622_03490 [Acinetobacter sp. PK01]